MQPLASETERASHRTPPSIDRISKNRKADRSEVNANLMGPAGLQPHPEQRHLSP